MEYNYKLSICIILAILFTAIPQVRSQKLGNNVNTNYGKLEGVKNADGTVVAFKGIPYAAPPVGNLRWVAPQPPATWKGVRDATHFCASCMQNRAFSREP